jgi:hypothetical protein
MLLDAVQHLADQHRVVRDYGYSHTRALPFVLVLHFGYRSVELAPETIQKALKRLALLLERMTAGNTQFDTQDADEHGAWGAGGPTREDRPRLRLKARDLALFVRLDDVADRSIREAIQQDAALVALKDFPHVILDVSQ